MPPRAAASHRRCCQIVVKAGILGPSPLRVFVLPEAVVRAVVCQTGRKTMIWMSPLGRVATIGAIMAIVAFPLSTSLAAVYFGRPEEVAH